MKKQVSDIQIMFKGLPYWILGVILGGTSYLYVPHNTLMALLFTLVVSAYDILVLYLLMKKYDYKL